MELTRKSWILSVLVLITLVLMSIPMLGCSDDDDDETTAPTTTTTTPAGETTTTTSGTTSTSPTDSGTPFVDEPIKIGIIQAWSGAGAMSGWLSDGVSDLFEWYINEKQGGILVGDVRRPIEFVKCDMETVTSQAAACATKLITDDQVSIITEGGTSTAQFFAIADVTDPEKVPYVHFGTNAELGTDYNWTATTISTADERAELFADFIVDTLKADSVSILAEEMADGRAVWDELKPMLEDAGIDILSEAWVLPGTADMSPNLTTVKYEAPDVLFSYLTAGTYTAMYKQIGELGGWDDIVNLAGNEHSNTPSVAGLPGANGSYTLVSYFPGSDDPGVVAFEQAWAQRVAEDPGFGKEYRPAPLSTHPYFWNCFVVATAAIELAGSDDPADIAKALRSGNLQADTAFGHVNIQPDGSANIRDHIAQIVNGELVQVD